MLIPEIARMMQNESERLVMFKEEDGDDREIVTAADETDIGDLKQYPARCPMTELVTYVLRLFILF